MNSSCSWLWCDYDDVLTCSWRPWLLLVQTPCPCRMLHVSLAKLDGCIAKRHMLLPLTLILPQFFSLSLSKTGALLCCVLLRGFNAFTGLLVGGTYHTKKPFDIMVCIMLWHSSQKTVNNACSWLWCEHDVVVLMGQMNFHFQHLQSATQHKHMGAWKKTWNTFQHCRHVPIRSTPSYV